MVEMIDLQHLFTPLFRGVIRYFTFAGIPFLIFYVWFRSKFLDKKIQHWLVNRKDILREISFSTQTILVTTGIIFLTFRTSFRGYTQFYIDFSEYPWYWDVSSFFIIMLFQDTYFYWTHRLMHLPGLFKYFHKVHHLSRNPTPWTSFSFNFLEALVQSLYLPLIVLLIPLHLYTLMVYALVSFMFNVYGHLGFEITPRWFRKTWLFEVMNTSVHHNLHHERSNGNFGYYFRIWDRLMGTENKEYEEAFKKVEERRYNSHTA